MVRELDIQRVIQATAWPTVVQIKNTGVIQILRPREPRKEFQRPQSA